MEEDGDLYDEFGNYIGPELESSSSEDDDDDDESASTVSSAAGGEDDNPDTETGLISSSTQQQQLSTLPADTSIVLHEDKKHYPSASETYGSEIHCAVLDEDAMDLDVPIVQPNKETKIALDHESEFVEKSTSHKPSKASTPSSGSPGEEETVIPKSYTKSRLFSTPPTLRRGLAVVGNFHTGKSTLMDYISETTKTNPDLFSSRASLDTHSGGGPRLTDTLLSEIDREMSLQSRPVSFSLPDSRGKSYLVTMVDCPGHVQFHDESVAVLRSVDGVLLCVDAVEGVQLHTELLMNQIVSEGLPCCLCITKVDRLIVELRLSPMDAYYKLRRVVEEVNEYFTRKSQGRYPEFSPEKENVCFGSGQHGWCLTLKQAARVYAEVYEDIGISLDQFASRLWGDWYYCHEDRRFYPKAGQCVDNRGRKRGFVEFVMEPIYKLYGICLGEDQKDVDKLMREFGVLLKKEDFRGGPRPLMRVVMKRFWGGIGSFVDMIVNKIPSPGKAAKGKVTRCYSGQLNTPTPQAMMRCDPNARLMIHIVKLYSSTDAQSFSAFGRIYSGTITPGTRVKVLGENYSLLDDEDSSTAIVTSVSIPLGRERIQVQSAPAGNWVLLDGIDSIISKTATVTDASPNKDQQQDPIEIFSPLSFPNAGHESVVKLAVEPLNPAELPKMVEGLRRISKSYPMARTRVEESGEHVLLGTGELYLDCMMHDLRHVFSDIEVKVADPVVAFRETVVESSCVKCFAETPNKRNKLTVLAEPLDEGLAEQLEFGTLKLDKWDVKKTGKFFQSQYDWDLLSSRSIWALGPSPSRGPNILLNDTLPSETDKALLQSVRSSITQGFQWSMREGPLAEEPIRATKLKILEVTLAQKAIHRGGGQIIPTARRAVHSAILTAVPRLMEPIYKLSIICPSSAQIISAIRPLLQKRRGYIVSDAPMPGTPLSRIHGFVPVMDSFGLETDVRTFTQGQAMVHSVFDHWAVVPGDPMDESIVLHPLEPSRVQHLAREFLVKTRRRKGLSEDVMVGKFLEEGMRELLLNNQRDGMTEG